MEGKSSIPYAGIQTFMGREYRDKVLGDEDVLIIGIPLDSGASYLPGTRFGPSAIRRASMIIKFYSENVGILDASTGEVILKDVKIVDLGDLEVPFGDQMMSMEYIYKHVSELTSSRAFKIFLGGDHSITYPIFKSFYKRYGDLHLIHIDAHLDILPSYAGNKYTHASPIYRIVNDLGFDPEKIHQIGVRGYVTSKESYEYAKNIGVDIYPLEDVRKMGIEKALDEIFDNIGGHKVYLTFDTDSLNPSIAPGTGVIEPGGLNYHEARIIMKRVGEANVIAADFVELAPPLDHNDITSKTLVYLIIDLLSGKFKSL